ncbi:outer membrane protein [Microvirga massiliensis]|uniref:outer membrane protein n=1 Tax=Microvirga massiliensis TaxID=1033741 RepID=UPI00062B5D5E|nr:outer membrane beta-barrel protein [Microvirga massiliensis]
MKKILLSSVALLGFTAGAMAADLPARAAPVAPVFTPVPVFTWTGFYVGVNAGWAWGNNNDSNGVFVPAGTFPGVASTTSGTLFVPGNDNDNEGFTGGGQIGYNYQIGSFVIGVEADFQGIASDNNNNNFFGAAPAFIAATGPGIPGDVAVVSTGGLRGLDWFGTVRARAGVAFDRWLVYATGGFAYGGGGDNNSFCGGVFFNCNNDDTRTGWTVGGGVEYAITNNFTARIEGLYVNLDSGNRFNGVVFDNASRTLFVGNGNNGDNEFGVVRAAVNYKFSTY